jgi:nicotinate-nucleotide adenylyltransferase
VRVGILGGTFDPIHFAHLIIAEEARACLRLDQVVFIPAGQPPHKQGKEITPSEHRVAMVQLAIASNPRFVLSRLDVDRAGPCYSVDTVELLKRDLEADSEVYFVLGLDSLAELPTWHNPARLIELCRLAVIQRPGFHVDLEQLEHILPGLRARLTLIGAPEMGISSRDIQHRVRVGLPIKYQLPEAVESYIYQHGLYRSH